MEELTSVLTPIERKLSPFENSPRTVSIDLRSPKFGLPATPLPRSGSKRKPLENVQIQVPHDHRVVAVNGSLWNCAPSASTCRGTLDLIRIRSAPTAPPIDESTDPGASTGAPGRAHRAPELGGVVVRVPKAGRSTGPERSHRVAVRADGFEKCRKASQSDAPITYMSL